jgi:hypothetical protein
MVDRRRERIASAGVQAPALLESSKCSTPSRDAEGHLARDAADIELKKQMHQQEREDRLLPVEHRSDSRRRRRKRS